ncbi:MAG TPA: DUF177 domain-containing protein [Bacteroidales bacterium]|nr:hypothetical protein [Bacteroidales bacterium]HRC88940.1 DUF177 domain-containing protein [Bacteroidales bacterium]
MTRLYTIPLFGLKEGDYTFDFIIGNDFFDRFEESEIKEGSLTATAGLIRYPSCIILTIKISGNVKICCDRCLDMYMQKIECENHLIIKSGVLFDNTDPDILIVPFGENELDLSQLFYEFIHLALPLRRIHPDDIYGKSGCNPEMIKELDKHVVTENIYEKTNLNELNKLLKNN